jgi:hypothetical protein
VIEEIIVVVIIDPEQHLDAVDGEDRAVVLAIRIIVPGNASKAATAARTSATPSARNAWIPGVIMIRPPRPKRRSSSFRTQMRVEL